ncbi:MAG TPA: PEP-CTERM sorting domain-containing protein [Lacunisphaera sp.]|jgi:hypothetical protein|nr:PEP-CTERM sorting domain-containing protein [Lacunisphaera sp.]HQY06493.1 PEP-CTERM sorting domain-containing protein [Lacunisphaera sp.]
MRKIIMTLRLLAGLGVVAGASGLGLAQITTMNGTPTGDPFSGNDWNVTNNAGSTQERYYADGMRAFRGSSGWDIGFTQGYAYTHAEVGYLDVAIYRYYARTVSNGGSGNFTSGQYNASATFSDKVTFTGAGNGSVTFDPVFNLHSEYNRGPLNTTYPSAPEPVMSGQEINEVQTVEGFLIYVLKNASNQTIMTVNQGYSDRYVTSGDQYSRSATFLSSGYTGGPVVPVSFALQTGYSVEIYGSASATVLVSAQWGGTNWGQADAGAEVGASISGLSEGWSYSTLSGATLTAVPEPSTYAMIAGALALGLAIWRRRAH